MMFTGALTALVTPFRGGQVDIAALRELVEVQIQAGIDGLVPCGSTGESINLSDREYRDVVRAVVEQTGGRVPVVAGAGTASTEHSLELAKIAREAKADGVMIVSPYYNKPTQEGLFAHFKTIALEASLPLVLYNIPGRTCVDISLETLERLAGIANIVAIKEATGNVLRSQEIVATFAGRFAVLAGDDALALAIMAVGGKGVISVSANVIPSQVVSVVHMFRDGDIAAALDLHQSLLRFHQAMFVETNPAPVKAALAMLGRIAPEIRLPLVMPSDASQEKIRAAIEMVVSR
ncbi:MAG: 4-hydroxy-tetrahydrodipicolinate synthase [Deltaproteobacteria bacterium]|nr:4-hydroxy-tetrahydrodipicolinate synthase [Deltaproteobacteria bacterium]